MVIQKLMKNPILVLGVLLFLIFIFDLKNKGFLKDRMENLTPTSCKSAIVMLNHRRPKNWNFTCKQNNLHVSISLDDSHTPKVETKNIRAFLYRELANSLVFISQNSLSESLERTMIIHLYIDHTQLGINAITEGKDIVQLKTMKNPKFIKDHLQKTVQVKEVLKK